MLKIQKYQNISLAIVEGEETIVRTVEDILDIIGNADYQEASKIIMKKAHFTNDFFDLKTGIAGEILQKFSTYRKQLAIVGDFTEIKSKPLRDFIRESNRVGRINFVDSQQKAMDVMVKYS